MDAKMIERIEELAKSIAGSATTMEELNSVVKSLMKSAIEQMLGAEMKLHLQEEQQLPFAALAKNTAFNSKGFRRRTAQPFLVSHWAAKDRKLKFKSGR